MADREKTLVSKGDIWQDKIIPLVCRAEKNKGTFKPEASLPARCTRTTARSQPATPLPPRCFTAFSSRFVAIATYINESLAIFNLIRQNILYYIIVHRHLNI